MRPGSVLVKTRSAPQFCARHLDFQQRASLLPSSIGTPGAASGQLLEQALLRLYMMVASSTSFQIRTSVKACAYVFGGAMNWRSHAEHANSKIPVNLRARLDQNLEDLWIW